MVYCKKNRAKYTFQSAWSPASKIIFAMSEKFPALRFVLKYYEARMRFKGVYEVRGGVVLAEKTEKYSGPRGG
jgi:hypothetical protein